MENSGAGWPHLPSRTPNQLNLPQTACAPAPPAQDRTSYDEGRVHGRQELWTSIPPMGRPGRWSLNGSTPSVQVSWDGQISGSRFGESSSFPQVGCKKIIPRTAPRDALIVERPAPWLGSSTPQRGTESRGTWRAKPLA